MLLIVLAKHYQVIGNVLNPIDIGDYLSYYRVLSLLRNSASCICITHYVWQMWLCLWSRHLVQSGGIPDKDPILKTLHYH